MRKYSTPKLFYGEFPYKLIWYSPLATHFRGGDLKYVRHKLDYHQQQLNDDKRISLSNWRGLSYVQPKELYQAQKLYTALTSDNKSRIRVEGSTVTVYGGDRDWMYKLATDIKASDWWEPAIDLEPNVLYMGPKLKGWEYRITFSTHVPTTFHDWAKNNMDKIKAGSVVKDFIKRRSTYMCGYYIYVRNEKMLNLITLVIGNGIQRVDKIVIDDKIA